MKHFFLFLLSIVYLIPVSAQSTIEQMQQTKPGDDQNTVNQILNSASSSLPEMRAQALLVLAESKLINDNKYKMKLIHQAFELARSASKPLSMAYSGGILRNDRSLVAWETYSYRLHLDRLSLQSRAVEDAHRLSPTMAGKMLEEIEFPVMPPVECSSALAYDPASYYDLLNVFIENKTTNSEFTSILDEAVGHLQTHTQILPIIQLLNNKNLTNLQQQDLTQNFMSRLSAFNGDARGFAALMSKQNLVGQIKQLYMSLKIYNPSAAYNLLYVWRVYMVANMKAGGCGAPWLFPRNQQGVRIMPRLIQHFNEEFKTELVNAGLKTVQLSEVEVQTVEITPDLQEFYQDAAAKNLFDQAYKLRFQDDGNRKQVSDLNSSAWQAQYTLYLTNVENMGENPMNSDKTFCEKVNLYNYAIDLAPQDDLRWLAIEDSLTLIENSRMQNERPLLWMWTVWTLQSTANRQMNGEKFAPRHDNDFTNRLIHSDNATLRLIGNVRKIGLDPFNGGPSL